MKALTVILSVIFLASCSSKAKESDIEYPSEGTAKDVEATESEGSKPEEPEFEEVLLCNDKRVDIVYIMDRSGSMDGLEKDVIGGYNAYIDEQMKGDKDVRITTILFDHDYEVLYDNEALSAAKLRDGQYTVRGSTALLDAVGTAVDNQVSRLSHLEAENKPCYNIVVIATDGEENSSRRFNNAAIKAKIEAQKEAGWDFLFFGANIDAFAAGGAMGIQTEDTYQFEATEEGIDKMYKDAAGGTKKKMAKTKKSKELIPKTKKGKNSVSKKSMK